MKHLLISIFLLVSVYYTPLQAQQTDTDEPQTFSEWLVEWFFGSDDKPMVSNAPQNLSLSLNLTGHWKFSIGDNPQWIAPEYNDSRWENIRVPARWENEGFNGYDGFAYYRVRFDGKLLSGKDAHYLGLGQVDDVDETYVNGQLVGKTGMFPPRFRTAYNSDRYYFIPNELINFNGDNVVVVKVYDQVLDGGIINGKPGIYIKKGEEELLMNLHGPWKFSPRDNSDYSRPDYDDADWNTLLAPSRWDDQGYRSLDGIAWYRKKFKLSFKPMPNTNYYLVLGKIDDFDMTFLNGQKIGETNDGKRYGASQSYNQLRIYKIPEGLLRSTGMNYISIKVIDIGNDGGIYDGPLGIVSEESVTRMMRMSN